MISSHALFGRHIPSEKAVLYGWGLYLSDDGYVFVRPQAGRYGKRRFAEYRPRRALEQPTYGKKCPFIPGECITVTASDGTWPKRLGIYP